MSIEEIRILINQQGKVQIEVSGITGPECLDVTQPLESLLGAVVEQRVFTSEFDATSNGTVQSGSTDEVVRRKR